MIPSENRFPEVKGPTERPEKDVIENGGAMAYGSAFIIEHSPQSGHSTITVTE
jgi:hypothetical protein